MQIAILTMNGGPTDVEGHRAGCADIAKKVNARKAEQPWVLEVNSEREAFLAYNEDFINEADGDESNGWTITWFPCCSELPPVHEDWFPTPEAAPVELEEAAQQAAYDDIVAPVTDDKPLSKTEAYQSVTAMRVALRNVDAALVAGDMGKLIDSLEDARDLASALRAVALDTGINTVTWVNQA